MMLVGIFFVLGYVALSAWLSWRYLRLFLGPLYSPVAKWGAPTQVFLTDYYVLLAQIALFTAPLLSKDAQEERYFAIPLIIALALFWLMGLRVLSKARVRKMWPRLVGQFLFPFEVIAALASGFYTIPLAIIAFVAPFVGLLVVLFFIVKFLFNKASNWIVSHADPLPLEPIDPLQNPTPDANTPLV